MSFFDWITPSGWKRRKTLKVLHRCSNTERYLLRHCVKLEVTDAWFIDHTYEGTVLVDYVLRFVEYKKCSIDYDNDLFEQVVNLISKGLLDYEEVENGFSFEMSRELKRVWSQKDTSYVADSLRMDVADMAVKCHRKKYGRIRYSLFPAFAHVTNPKTLDNYYGQRFLT